MNTLISRKVIKHCINQILNKYKSSINIVNKEIVQNGEKVVIPNIKIIDKINGVSIEESQDLIDSLYKKYIDISNKVIEGNIKESFKFS